MDCYASDTRVGRRASPTDLVITVGFEGTAKEYDYFTSVAGVNIGDTFIVNVAGTLKYVTVRSVRMSSTSDRLKYVVRRSAVTLSLIHI